ncbi:MAG TPA: DNA glycosylase, partial [Clostridia bacterium]|nr:DNA glycosylase [Clostridia bacterium]
MKSDKNKLKMTIPDFEPRHIFECGQCFRWNREEDGSYTGVAGGRVLNVLKHENEIIFDNVVEGDFEKIWEN